MASAAAHRSNTAPTAARCTWRRWYRWRCARGRTDPRCRGRSCATPALAPELAHAGVFPTGPGYPSDMPPQRERVGVGLLIVRYGLGGAMVVAGIVMIAVNPGGFGVD